MKCHVQDQTATQGAGKGDATRRNVTPTLKGSAFEDCAWVSFGWHVRKLQAEEVGGVHDGNYICCAVEKAARDRPRLLRSPRRGLRGSEGERKRQRAGGGTTNPNNIERIFKYAAAEELALNGSKRDRQRRREGEEWRVSGGEEEGPAGTARGRVVDVHTHIFFGDFDLWSRRTHTNTHTQTHTAHCASMSMTVLMAGAELA